MSDHVEGLVARVSEKAAGQGTVYNICLEIEGQDDEWFGHGFDEPKFCEGDFIEFDIEWNGKYANVDKASVNVLEEGEGNKKPSRSSGRSRGSQGSSRGGSRGSGSSSRGGSRGSNGSSRGGSKPAAKRSSGNTHSKGGTADKMSKDEWAQKDQMIRRQACMNTSIKLVTLLLAEGAVSIPKKKADAYDALVALCDEEAERLYDQYEEQVYGVVTPKRPKARAQDEYDDDIPQ